MSARGEPPASPCGGGIRLTMASSTAGTPFPGLRGDMQDVGAGTADDAGDLVGPLLRLGAGQVDLVEHRDDLQVVLEGQQGIGEGLRLYPLRGVDHQDGPLTRRQTPRHLIGEVHVAGGIDEVELVLLAVLGQVVDAHRLSLDGDAPLALQVHAVEHLLTHVAFGDRVGHLQDAVGQRRLAVVDVGDYGEVADVFEACHEAQYSSVPLAYLPTLPTPPAPGR